MSKARRNIAAPQGTAQVGETAPEAPPSVDAAVPANRTEQIALALKSAAPADGAVIIEAEPGSEVKPAAAAPADAPHSVGGDDGLHMGRKTVAVAMSGGVDSSTTAALLVRQGFKVIGLTMQIWPDDLPHEGVEGGCCSLAAVDDARRVAYQLGIPYYVLNFKEQFREGVIDEFCTEYYRGRTPNPCVTCNKLIKFDLLLRRSLQLGADYLATGHYARIMRDPQSNRYLLLKGIDDSKDQSYALYMVTQYQLSHLMFPLGDYTKAQVRSIAAEMGLAVAHKGESQEICFIPDNDYRGFLAQYTSTPPRPGKIVDTHGRVLGTHEGIHNFTIGQRKGLGIASNRPMYVVELDPDDALVVVGYAEEASSSGLVATGCNWISVDRPHRGMRVQCKVRYKSEPVASTIIAAEGGQVEVEFDSPVYAVTPGQSAVFYDGDTVVGGGTIDQAVR